ncbi:hypothetical protein A33Q_1759 [Indibacter alkaliphilus LW1]|uniref:Uncharacterized protein n=1 Tax=Indibacter alkaliphilus (strain CCUG 57479 / KCTC 22604 / LW1) TaxID=1189612 RepID=S2DJ17_INDAL|nr:hypothetical protein A33Q_1759 [Indibacter alkaliphilus LW1]
MEKIIIEVDQLTAAKWDSVSPIKKKEISIVSPSQFLLQ